MPGRSLWRGARMGAAVLPLALAGAAQAVMAQSAEARSGAEPAPRPVTQPDTQPALAAAPLVRLPQGLAEGVRLGAVERFAGLPYGAAERWASPIATGPWLFRLAAQALPPRCPQSAAGLAAGTEREDCLYLNVYRPAAASAQPRAVLVYVHGGGATGGSANDHDGSALAEQGDLIVVTVNYRLGALGFFNGGNYALQDVLLALEWVRHSIAALGGDPRKVTLAGESAGGTVICPLLAAPEAQGLFRAAIISSDDCLHDVDTAAEATQRAEALARRLGCDGIDLACMRRATPPQLVSAGGGAAPAIGQPGLLPDYAVAQISRHHWLRVPLLLGANRDEGRMAGPGFFRYDEQRYQDWLAALLPPAQRTRVSDAYRDDHAGDPLEYAYKISAILTDSGMRGLGGCTMLPLAQAAARDAPVYFYQFEDDQAPYGEAGAFQFGAAHAAELPYLWPGGGAFVRHTERMNAGQRQLSVRMIAHWAAFVRNGTPDVDGQPAWPSLQQRSSFRAFRQGASVQLPLDDYAAQHRCGFWRQLPVIMDRGDSRP